MDRPGPAAAGTVPEPRSTQDGATRCPECGAPAAPHSCAELFQVLLALDHSRQEPWGPLHAVSVCCYMLQHPGGSETGVDARRAMLRTYLDGGLPAVTRLTDRARRANSHAFAGARLVESGGGAAPVGPFVVTIVDVAENGDFPADRFEERLRRWVEATVSA